MPERWWLPSNHYVFILNLTPGFNGLSKGNCKTRRDTFKFLNLVRLVSEVWLFSIDTGEPEAMTLVLFAGNPINSSIIPRDDRILLFLIHMQHERSPCTYIFNADERIWTTILTSAYCISYNNLYRQMGELWTLVEVAYLQYLTRNMVVEMDGNISRVLFCR